MLSASIAAGLAMTGTAVAQQATTSSDQATTTTDQATTTTDQATTTTDQATTTTDQAATPASPATAPGDKEAKYLEKVIVRGIRGAIEQSLEAKREENTRVEVVTSEDIGKMPDKNVADSLSRVPGVTISAASANEGAFDENDRVSMRGTSPSYTQTLIDGHNVASGDWFVLNQSGTVGRSVSYSLLPAELVDKVIVRKSSEAKLVEGGATGNVDIITRNPLNFHDGFSIFGSAGTVYADRPDTWDPQISVLANFKNEAGTFGVTIQGFSEERHLQREGQEILGYDQIDPASAIAQSNPDLAGVFYPHLIGSALFEQDRKRKGGMVSAQFKATDDLVFEANYFTSKMDADNYNRNYMLWGAHVLNQGNGQAPDPGYVVRDNTLVLANFTADPTRQYGIYDEISRPGEESSTNFFSFGADWNASDNLHFNGELGTSKGHGKTPTQDVAEWDVGKGTGAGWSLHGVGGADWNLGSADTSQPGVPNVDYGLDWIFGFNDIDVEDKEDWGKIDGTYFVNGSALQSIDFGVRAAKHERDNRQVTNQGPNFAAPISPFDPAAWPQGGFENYPGNFGSGLGGIFPRNIWYFTPEQLALFNSLYANRDPVARFDWSGAYGLEEHSNAAYAQFNFKGARWSGNVGVRFVQTKEKVDSYVGTNATDPDAITTSAFGPYKIVQTDHTYNDWLPSANFKYDINADMLLRLAASRTLTRPDYSALASSVTLLQPGDLDTGVGGGSGGNPDLEPIVSTNLDATWEWYFAPRAYVSVGAFYMNIDNYVALTRVRREYLTFDATHPAGVLVPYDITIPVNSGATVTGAELAWQQPFTDYFGAFANYTYANGSTDDGTPMLGTSKNTYNLGAYFENSMFNARINFTHRSSFYSGLDRATAFFQDTVENVSASFGWKITDNWSLNLDAQNLNNPKTKYYAESKERPRSIYENGRQYYLTVRFNY
jgi:iron complex outermembrane receptor protein